jgi:hypothetical protein
MSGPGDAFDVIARALSPFLGENMARAAVRSNAQKLGLSGAPAADDCERLLAALRPGLSVFVGREKTDRVLDDVRRELEGRR